MRPFCCDVRLYGSTLVFLGVLPGDPAPVLPPGTEQSGEGGRALSARGPAALGDTHLLTCSSVCPSWGRSPPVPPAPPPRPPPPRPPSFCSPSPSLSWPGPQGSLPGTVGGRREAVRIRLEPWASRATDSPMGFGDQGLPHPDTQSHTSCHLPSPSISLSLPPQVPHKS